MKHLFLLFLFMFALLVLTSCNLIQNNQPDIDVSNATNKNTLNKNVISKETAILIAKRATWTEYNFDYLDPVVIDKGENWMVTFDLKPELKIKNIVGGAPTVVIEKRSGNIVSMSGTK